MGHNWAELYRSTGNLVTAKTLHIQAMEILRTTVGETDPRFATSLNNLGSLYYSLGQPKSAEPLLQQAMEIRGSVLGKQHPV